MIPETDLPHVLAPPLVPDASFDADVAAAFDAEWLSVSARPAGRS